MWSRLRHRAAQSAALVLLAALLTACAGVGPLYQRAIEQALASTTLDRASPSDLVVSAASSDETPDQLVADRPAALDPYLGDPVLATSVRVALTTDDGVGVSTRLRSVDGECEHLRLVAGRCPERPGEVMISQVDQRLFGWGLDRSRRVTQIDPLGPYGQTLSPRVAPVEIVGEYTTGPDDGWAGDVVVGRGRTPSAGSNGQESIVTDDWLTVPGSITGRDALARWTTVTGSAAWPLRREAVDDVEDLLVLGRDLESYRSDAFGGAPGVTSGAADVEVTTTLPELAASVDRGRTQSRATVTALTAQVLLLVLVVFALVVAAAVEQRRPEVALARLRGRGRRGATTYLLAELVPLVLLGVVAGGGLALGVSAVLGSTLLPGAPVEVPRGFVLAWAAAGVVALVVAAALAVRTGRAPIGDLLLTAPRRRGVAGLVGEVAVLVAAGTTVGVFLTGNLTGALAAAAPALLALVVGLLLGRLVRPVGAGLGRLALGRGRAAVATGLLQASRRPATRRVVVLVVLATSVFVFSGIALVSADRNRALAAEQEAGAPVVMVLGATGPLPLGEVVDAVRKADPGREELSPVVTAAAPGGGATTVGVDPVAFARVARFPLVADPSDLGLGRVAAPDAPPLTVTGRDLTGSASFEGVEAHGAGDVGSGGTLVLQVLLADGTSRTVTLGDVATGRGADADSDVAIDAGLPCADGCEVTGLTVTASPAVTISGRVTLTGLAVDGDPVALGPAPRWRPVEGDDGRLEATDADGDDGLTVDFASGGTEPPLLTRTWVPQPLLALVTRGPASGDLDALGLGSDVPMRAVGTVPRVPATGPDARLVDVESLRRLGDRIDSGSLRVELWARSSDDPATVAALHRLDRLGVSVVSTRRLDDVARELDETPAAWSLDLAGPAGLACLLLAGAVLVVIASTTRRARVADLAALTASGAGRPTTRRVAAVEAVPWVLVGVLVGAACGVVGAQVALPSVRLFTTTPATSTLDLSLPWPAVAGLVGAALVLLGVVALVTGRGGRGRSSGAGS